jgi:hypothetical protein
VKWFRQTKIRGIGRTTMQAQKIFLKITLNAKEKCVAGKR